jgi:hypothetical protein
LLATPDLTIHCSLRRISSPFLFVASLNERTGVGVVVPRTAVLSHEKGSSHDLLDRGGASRVNRFMLQLIHKF